MSDRSHALVMTVSNALVGEEEHLQADLDGNDGPEDLCPSHDLHGPLESLDLARMSLKHLCREYIGPELLS